MTGAAITAFAAAQIGVVVATPGGSPVAQLKTRSFGANNQDTGETAVAWLTIAILAIDFAVLVIAGFFYVRLFMTPSRAAVQPGAPALKEAPDYIALQAKAFRALVTAGAAGVGIAAAIEPAVSDACPERQHRDYRIGATGEAMARVCDVYATRSSLADPDPTTWRTQMPGLESRDFTTPDETRTPDKTTVELVNIGGGQIGRYTFQPGWRWSECIKPVVGTDSCQVEHIGYVVSGSLHVTHEDGTEGEVKPGDVYRIAPGHDAWVVGNEAAVFVEFQGAANYAKPRG